MNILRITIIFFALISIASCDKHNPISNNFKDQEEIRKKIVSLETEIKVINNNLAIIEGRPRSW
jgi:hypothetical protein